MYDYDYEREKNRKFEPNIKLNAKDRAIEIALIALTGGAIVFFFFKVMFF